MPKPRVSGQSKTDPRKKDLAETPWSFIRALEKREGIAFTLDAFATPENAKAPRFYTPEQDGFVARWNSEYIWANPPYSGDSIPRACAKAVQDMHLYSKAYLLLPPNVDVAWFGKYAPKAQHCIFVTGRIQFVGDYAHGNDTGSLILVFSRYFRTGPWQRFWAPTPAQRGGKGSRQRETVWDEPYVQGTALLRRAQ